MASMLAPGLMEGQSNTRPPYFDGRKYKQNGQKRTKMKEDDEQRNLCLMAHSESESNSDRDSESESDSEPDSESDEEIKGRNQIQKKRKRIVITSKRQQIEGEL